MGTHGFVREPDGTITSFDVPGLIWHINDISPSGRIAGSSLESNGMIHGFVRDADGAITLFDAPGAGFTLFDTPGPNFPGGIGCGHCDGTLSTAMNPKGRIVGYFGDANGAVHGFLRKANGSIHSIDAPHSTHTYVQAINAEGLIAGVYLDDTNQVWHPFLIRNNGRIDSFDVPGSINSEVTGMTPSNEIVGYYQDAMGAARGLVLGHGKRERRDTDR